MLRKTAILKVSLKRNGKLILRSQCNDYSQLSLSRNLIKTSLSDTTLSQKNDNKKFTRYQRNQLTPVFDYINLFNDDTDKNEDWTGEYRYAFNYFKNSIYYKDTTVTNNTVALVTDVEATSYFNKDWTVPNEIDVYQCIRRLSYHCLSTNSNISSHMYEPILQAMIDTCSDLDNTKFINLLKYLIPLQAKISACSIKNNVIQFIDKQCHKRYGFVDIKTGLLLCDIIAKLKVMRDLTFTNRILLRLGRRYNKFSAKNLVQYLFYLSLYRKPHGINMFNLEYQLAKHINDLSINEMGIVAMGFFKTNAKLKTLSLLDTFLNKIISNIDVVDSITLSAQMKLLRGSHISTHSSLYRLFLKTIIPYLHRFDSTVDTHIAHYSAIILIYEPEVIDIIIKRLHNNIHTARLKDFERILFTMTTFNIRMEDTSLYSEVIEEISKNRTDEINRHKESLPRILSYLTYVNIYPLHLIEQVMKPEYVSDLCRQNYGKEGRCHFTLENSLKIEVPEYSGPFLKNSTNRIIAKTLYDNDLNTIGSKSANFTTEVLHILKETIDKNCIHIDRILPHVKHLDIIITFNENKPTTDVSTLQDMPCNMIKFIPENLQHLKWIVFVLAHSSYLIRSTSDFSGRFNTKIRQLQRLGYRPIIVNYGLWTNFKDEEKREEIHKFLNNAIK